MTIRIPNRLYFLRTRAFTLVELLVAVAVGFLVLTSVVVLFVYGMFSFAGLGNYAILTGQSRRSLDVLSREIRQATQLVDYSVKGSTKSLTLTNSLEGTSMTCNWDADTKVLTFDKSDLPSRICLAGCDAWDVSFFQRTPNQDWVFYPATTPKSCRLINMNWKCSRTILGKRINSETVVTAQVVLRNKP